MNPSGLKLPLKENRSNTFELQDRSNLERSRRQGELSLNVLKQEEGLVGIEQLEFPFRDVSAKAGYPGINDG